MSILQEYNQHFNYINQHKMDALQEYIKLANDKDNEHLRYDTIVYKKSEWEKFENWYEIIYNNRYGKGPK